MDSEHASAPTALAKPWPSWRTRLPFFYGWVVVASSFLSSTFAFGVWLSFGVFFVALVEEYGWTRGATSGVFSLFVLMNGLGGMVAGRLVDRFGPARLMPGGALILAVGLLATSQLDSLWQFYAFFSLICGLGVSVCGWVPTVAVVSRWFTARRAAAIGVAGAGIGLAAVVIVPVCQYLILTYGWRSAYQILAATVLLGIVPQAALLLVGRPEELGLRPDGAREEGEGALRQQAQRRARKIAVVDQAWASFPWSARTAVQTRRFWLLVVTFGLTAVYNQMLWAHQVAYMVDVGFDKMLAASMSSTAGAVSMPGKLFWGWLSDRWGRERAFTVAVVACLGGIAALVALTFVPSIWVALLFAVLFGIGYAVSSPVLPAAAADLFAGRNFGSIYGLSFFGNALGSAIGPFMAGYVFDLTGSYIVAFTTAGVSAVVAAVCLWWAAPRLVRRVVRQHQAGQETVVDSGF